jgi:hypothetical protein
MDLFPDFKDLLAAFAASGVRYVVVGGYAVIFHGRPRATKDLDLLVELSDENRERVASALLTFGAPADIASASRVLRPEDVVYFGSPPLRVDILGSASGIEFGEVYARAVEAKLDDVPVRVIALDDLIANKRASGRPRDMEDCAELERLRAKIEQSRG